MAGRINLLRCRLCGGELMPPWDGEYLCKNCGSRNHAPLPVEDPMTLEDELVAHRKGKKAPEARTGQLEMEMGMNAAEDRAGEQWVAKARKQISALCLTGVPFSADEVVAVVGLPPGTSHNALGAVFRKVAAEGWIVQAGYRASSRPDRHGGMVKVWRSAS